jgi:hypothetical protein
LAIVLFPEPDTPIAASVADQATSSDKWMVLVERGYRVAERECSKDRGCCADRRAADSVNLEGMGLTIPPSLLARADEAIDVKRREFIIFLGGAAARCRLMVA